MYPDSNKTVPSGYRADLQLQDSLVSSEFFMTLQCTCTLKIITTLKLQFIGTSCSYRSAFAFCVFSKLEIFLLYYISQFLLSKIIIIRNSRNTNNVFNEIHYFHLTPLFGVYLKNFYHLIFLSCIKICLRITDETTTKVSYFKTPWKNCYAVISLSPSVIKIIIRGERFVAARLIVYFMLFSYNKFNLQFCHYVMSSLTAT